MINHAFCYPAVVLYIHCLQKSFNINIKIIHVDTVLLERRLYFSLLSSNWKCWEPTSLCVLAGTKPRADLLTSSSLTKLKRFDGIFSLGSSCSPKHRFPRRDIIVRESTLLQKRTLTRTDYGQAEHAVRRKGGITMVTGEITMDTGRIL